MLQKLPVGAVTIYAPFDEPQTPSMLVDLLAEQPVLAPPLIPWQFQYHGPEPVTPEALPELQRTGPEGAEAL